MALLVVLTLAFLSTIETTHALATMPSHGNPEWRYVVSPYSDASCALRLRNRQSTLLPLSHPISHPAPLLSDLNVVLELRGCADTDAPGSSFVHGSHQY